MMLYTASEPSRMLDTRILSPSSFYYIFFPLLPLVFFSCS